jgi:hypothetical protein
LGRAIAQAVSRRLPTAAAGARSQVRSCGICGGQSGTGAGFLRVLWFPLPILIPSTILHSSSIIRGWYNRPDIGRCTKWTRSHPTTRNKKSERIWFVCRPSCGLPNAVRVYIASLSTLLKHVHLCTSGFGTLDIDPLKLPHHEGEKLQVTLLNGTEVEYRRFSIVCSHIISIVTADQPSRCSAALVNSIEITFSGLLPWRRSPSVRSPLASITSLSFTHKIWALYHPRFPSATQKFTASCEISSEYVPAPALTYQLIGDKLWQG